MRNFSTEAKVGLLAIVAVFLVVYFASRTDDIPSGAERGRGFRLYAILDDVSGITKATPVEIAGVKVGVVDAVDLRGKKAQLTLLMKKDVALPTDSTLIVQPKGLLGDKVLVINPGETQTSDDNRLKDKDKIRPGESPPDLNEILKRANSVTKDVKDISEAMRDTLGSEEAEERMQSILANIETFSTDMADISSANRQALEEVVENLRVLSEQLRETVARTNEGVDASFGDLEEAADKLDATLASVKSVAAKVDEGEGTIGKLINDPTTAEGLETAIEGVNDIVERVNRVKIFIDYHNEALAFGPSFGFDADAAALKNYLGIRIQPHPDYYYAVELVDDPRGLTTEKTTTYTDVDAAGNTTIRTETERKVEDKFKLSIQFARRLHNASFRLGIKESTGGVGLDYHLFKDRFHLSIDAFEFARGGGENPHLKFMAQYDVHKHIFIVGGADDFVSVRNLDGTIGSSRSFFVGAGLTFNDDDLKFVLGSLPIPGG